MQAQAKREQNPKLRRACLGSRAEQRNGGRMKKVLFFAVLVVLVFPILTFGQDLGVMAGNPENSPVPLMLGLAHNPSRGWVFQGYLPYPEGLDLEGLGLFGRAWYRPTPTWELGPAVARRFPVRVIKTRYGEVKGLEVLLGGWAPLIPEPKKIQFFISLLFNY